MRIPDYCWGEHMKGALSPDTCSCVGCWLSEKWEEHQASRARYGLSSDPDPERWIELENELDDEYYGGD